MKPQIAAICHPGLFLAAKLRGCFMLGASLAVVAWAGGAVWGQAQTLDRALGQNLDQDQGQAMGEGAQLLPSFTVQKANIEIFRVKERRDAPRRVVSINLCADQLAMLLAGPGQLISVSYLARDPLSSAMSEEAAHYPINRASAEQIFLMQPDLVLAGEYTAPATLALLERLGVKVLRLPSITSLAEVPGLMRLTGQALGQEVAAESMAAAFQKALRQMQVELPPARAALYYPNGYTLGEGTLAHEVLELTGFQNIAIEAGLAGGGIMALEELVLAAPEVIVTSTPYPGASRSEAILSHPALMLARETAGLAATSDADWTCGTPYLLRAVAAMKSAREAL